MFLFAKKKNNFQKLVNNIHLLIYFSFIKYLVFISKKNKILLVIAISYFIELINN